MNNWPMEIVSPCSAILWLTNWVLSILKPVKQSWDPLVYA